MKFAAVLSEAELNDIAHVRGCAENGSARVGDGTYCVVRVESLRVLLEAFDRFERRDGLMRKQLVAEQAARRRKR